MLNTFSKFYFGHFINQSNKSLPFNDGTDKVATLKVGDYTLNEFGVEIARALNAASSISFTVTVNRTTRLITIAGDSNFELHVASGTASNPFSLIGFSGSDRSGSNSYTGNLASGSEFKNQLKLQKFVDFTDDQTASYSNVAKSANGTVEVISFGTDEFMTCEIAYQTNNNVTGSAIENQANGLDNLRTFLQYAVNKRKVEFIPDRDTPGTFTKCILESTNASSSGTGYRLKEYLSSTPGFFSSGVLKFRKVV
tara:strand:- start:16256 stop:17014 length:759 start_codon:yes stop_codon:yes gene_type:complete